MWAESATPHNGSSEVIGKNEPITTIHNQEKKTFTFCLLKLHWFSHCHDQFPEKQQHLFHGLCYVSDSQRTGNPCLGTWEDGSEAAAYMALSCPVASNDSVPPAGFHHQGALQCPEQHPQLETGNPENWDAVKPLSHNLEDIWTLITAAVTTRVDSASFGLAWVRDRLWTR